MAGLEHTVQRLGELPRDTRILTGRTAYGKDDNGQTRKYTICEKVGQGGMGVVYKGIDEQGRTVALKLLDCKDPKFVNALKREARLMSEITHPNIRQVFDFYENIHLDGDGQEPMPMLVMEYVPGHALEVTKVNAGNFCKYFVQMADSLEFLHGQGCIHRDIKPENFIITDDDQVKLCDFGVSRIVDEHTSLLVSGGLTADRTVQNIAGTRAYLPKNPEELANPDKRTDLYSLGLVLYQMILGDASMFPDPKAGIRAENAAAAKKLPMPKELAELVCNLALEERNERPADVDAIKEKDRELYTAIEDAAGLPVLWNRICKLIVKGMKGQLTREYRSKVEPEVTDELKYVGKSDRIAGIDKILNKRFITLNSPGIRNELLDLVNTPVKNKEDAELEMQTIKYFLKTAMQIPINGLIDWENRIKEYQSKFGIDAAETLGIIGKVVEQKRENTFDFLLRQIESNGEQPADITERIRGHLKSGNLTFPQADKLSEMLDKREAKNKPEDIEDIKEKYKRFADSLEDKTVTPEFKEAFAMAAYKEGISQEYIDNILLNTLEYVRKKSLADRIKKKIKRSRLIGTLSSLVNVPEPGVGARTEAEAIPVLPEFHKNDSGYYVLRKLKQIHKIGREHNIFVGDLIEKVILAYAGSGFNESGPMEQISNAAMLGHKYSVNIKSVLGKSLDKFMLIEWGSPGTDSIFANRVEQMRNELYTDLQQKYPNAFKETPKFEDLERMVEGEGTKESFLKEVSLHKFMIGYQQYLLGAGVGMIAGILPDLILSSTGLISWLGISAGLATVTGLRAHTAWKKAKEIEKEKLREQAIASEEGLPKDLKLRDIHCVDKEQLGSEIKRYVFCSDKAWFRSQKKLVRQVYDKLRSDEEFLKDIKDPKKIGVITRHDMREDSCRQQYCEMNITIYENKAKEKPQGVFIGIVPSDLRKVDLTPESPLEPAKEELKPVPEPIKTEPAQSQTGQEPVELRVIEPVQETEEKANENKSAAEEISEEESKDEEDSEDNDERKKMLE